MLVNVIPQLQKWRYLPSVRAFFSSGWYIACIVLLMACSELFSLELYVIPAYLVLGTVCVLLCEDLLGIVPMAACGYMLFAAENNPGKFPITGLFAQKYAQDALFLYIGLAVVILLARFITKICERKKRGVPKLTAGYVLLGISYLLGGAFTTYYDARTVFFGFVEIASLSFFYFFFYFSVDWEKVPEHYAPLLVTILGVGLFAQVLGMYTNPGAPTLDGGGSRDSLYTGWGIWNCIGAMMAFCVSAPVYFAVKRKNGWLYTLLSTVYLLGVILTQSRGSMLAGAGVYVCGVLVTLVKSRGKERLWNFLVYAVLLLGGIVILVRYRDAVSGLLSTLIEIGVTDSGRFSLYEQAWGVFQEHPFFGVGWYDVPGIQFAQGGMYPNGHPILENYFIPGFVHDTFFQLLAMGGVLAFFAYLIHRTDTVLLFFRRPTTAKTVSGICILAILLASIVDNHVFNLGPGLLYSILLVFAEKADERVPDSKFLRVARP